MESMVMADEFGMDELMAQSAEIKPGTVIDGTVVSQTDSHLLINVGLKQEAALPLKELSAQIPPVGSQIPVLLLRVSGPEGRPLVSWRQAREKKNWDRVAELHKSNQTLQGKILQKVKGGFSVDIGLDAFMPASQVDEKPLSDPNLWIGKTVEVFVLEMDRAKGNVLVSHRRVVANEKAIKRAATLEHLKVGEILKGKVTGLTNFGAFMDIGGIEGLLHVSDIAWTHVDKPHAVVKVGDEFEVKVLKYDSATHRISLGRKQLLTHPWEGIEKRFPIGTLVKGKVTGLAEFGAFIQIEPGVEGLIHVSEFSWTERVKRPHGFLKTGQEVEARLIGIDREKEKISLSLRRVGQSPWQEAMHKHPVGSVVEGEITHLTSFGAFVRIPSGIEALLKTQDFSWTDKIHSPQHILKVGEKVKAVVLEVNPQEEKMAIGLKQLTPDPFKALKIGQEVSGTVVKVTDFGAFVKLSSGLDALIRHNELQLHKSIFSEGSPNNSPQEPTVKEGDPITASIIKISKKDRKLELSVRQLERKQEKDLLRKYSGSGEKLTLADTTGWGQSESES